MATANYSYIQYKQTGFFSKLVTDYLGAHQALDSLYVFKPNLQGIIAAVQERNKFHVDRQLLVQVLQDQYSGFTQSALLQNNIASLRNQNTFTICTAHQPNLLGGYLYFVYKILQTIHLAAKLKAEMPHMHFVPVYYMGAEDNDLEELGRFRYNNHNYIWNGNGQTGAVGRMKTDGLQDLLNDLFKHMGPPGENYNQLKAILTEAYTKHNTIAAATQYWVNELFGKYGLVIINPDDSRLKQSILPVLQDELLHGNSYHLVTETCKSLEHNYKIQATPRALNLFYLKDNLRERIEKDAHVWKVLHTDISWNETELLAELHTHPERFSPNVILRGILQETILPNVAFIGGGAELAYWLELGGVFKHYGVFYPPILLRQSALWIQKPQHDLLRKIGLSISDLYKNKDSLIEEFVRNHSQQDISLSKEAQNLQVILNVLLDKASNVDATLGPAALAVKAKIQKQLQVLEHKMLRAAKRKMNVDVQRIEKLKHELFPNGSLQERTENFITYYLQYGAPYFDVLLEGMNMDAFLICAE